MGGYNGLQRALMREDWRDKCSSSVDLQMVFDHQLLIMEALVELLEAKQLKEEQDEAKSAQEGPQEKA